jgi:hypothetical protein
MAGRPATGPASLDPVPAPRAPYSFLNVLGVLRA